MSTESSQATTDTGSGRPNASALMALHNNVPGPKRQRPSSNEPPEPAPGDPVAAYSNTGSPNASVIDIPFPGETKAADDAGRRKRNIYLDMALQRWIRSRRKHHRTMTDVVLDAFDAHFADLPTLLDDNAEPRKSRLPQRRPSGGRQSNVPQGKPMQISTTDEEWWVLSEEAKRHGVSVSHMLAVIVSRAKDETQASA